MPTSPAIIQSIVDVISRDISYSQLIDFGFPFRFNFRYPSRQPTAPHYSDIRQQHKSNHIYLPLH